MLYVTTESLRAGTAAHVHVNEIIAGLVRRGWEVELIQPDYGGTAGSPGVTARIGNVASISRRTLRLLEGAELVYLRSNPTLLGVASAAARRGRVVVQECNGPYAEIAVAHPWTRRILPLLSAMQRRQYRTADCVITVTRQLQEWLAREAGRDDVRLVTNAANTEMFRPDVEMERPVEGPYVVFFGALAAWHGVTTLLAAAAHPAWPAGVKLVVIGAGACSGEVEAAAARLPHVVHLGRQPYERMPALVAGALAGIVATELAGDSSTGLAPLKLFETLSAGLPVIATEYPTQADFVRDNACGLIVPPRDPAAMAAAVARLAGDAPAAAAMGARGRAAVVREHSWDHRAAEVDRILRELVAAKQAQSGRTA
jgi:glycosyltransferase involved in cell wall biosynthesis